MKQSVVSVLRTSTGLDEYPLYKYLLRSDLDIVNFDDRIYCWHEAPSFCQRIFRRLGRRRSAQALDEQIILYMMRLRPSHLLIFKGSSISPKVIHFAKEMQVKTIVMYPDLDPFVHGDEYVSAIHQADQLFHTKPNLVDFFSDSVNPRSNLIGPLYDPDYSQTISPADPNIGVSFVGHYSPGKANSILELARVYDGRISIFGDGWKKDTFNNTLADIRVNSALYGESVNLIYRKSICVLGFLMESVSERNTGDEITSRSILVPAYGGLLLHKKTPSAKNFLGYPDEVLYESTIDLCQKIKYIRDNPIYREKLANQQSALARKTGTDAAKFIQEHIQK